MNFDSDNHNNVDGDGDGEDEDKYKDACERGDVKTVARLFNRVSHNNTLKEEFDYACTFGHRNLAEFFWTRDQRKWQWDMSDMICMFVVAHPGTNDKTISQSMERYIREKIATWREICRSHEPIEEAHEPPNGST